jgi:hypothetical protein
MKGLCIVTQPSFSYRYKWRLICDIRQVWALRTVVPVEVPCGFCFGSRPRPRCTSPISRRVPRRRKLLKALWDTPPRPASSLLDPSPKPPSSVQGHCAHLLANPSHSFRLPTLLTVDLIRFTEKKDYGTNVYIHIIYYHMSARRRHAD